MISVDELLRAQEPGKAVLEQTRALLKSQRSSRPKKAKVVSADRAKVFLSSRVWRVARYAFLRKQARPLRCACCGASASDTRLAVDHIVPLRTEEGWRRRLDETNFQILCAVECNWAGKGFLRDQTDWRAPPGPA